MRMIRSRWSRCLNVCWWQHSNNPSEWSRGANLTSSLSSVSCTSSRWRLKVCSTSAGIFGKCCSRNTSMRPTTDCGRPASEVKASGATQRSPAASSLVIRLSLSSWLLWGFWVEVSQLGRASSGPVDEPNTTINITNNEPCVWQIRWLVSVNPSGRMHLSTWLLIRRTY